MYCKELKNYTPVCKGFRITYGIYFKGPNRFLLFAIQLGSKLS